MIYQQVAHKYIESGISVIPSAWGGKGPRSIGWDQYCKRIPTEQEVENWISNPGKQNITCCLGPVSNLLALDFDLEESHPLYEPITEILPRSICGKVGKKGITYFFKFQGDYQGEKKIEYSKGRTVLEIMWTGNNVVIPPSIHPDTNEPYRWVGYDLVDCYDDLPEIKIPEILKLIEKIKLLINNKSTNGGRHNKLLSMCFAALNKGKQTDLIVSEIISYDQIINSPPYFSDTMEFRNSNPELNAKKMVESAIKTLGKKQNSIEEKIKENSVHCKVKFLGVNGAFCFYAVKETGQIIKLKSSEHVKSNLCILADFESWMLDYDNLKGSVDINKIFDDQRKIGVFTEEKVRGSGLWLDEERKVINCGTHLIVDGKQVDLYDDTFKSEFHYESGKKLQVDATKKLTKVDLENILKCIDYIAFKNPNDKIYLLGFLFYAQIFNLLSWKPNIWLTGGRGSGKTSILDFISKKFFSHISNQIIQDTTGAGLKQFIRNDSRLVFIDEAEPNTFDGKMRLEQVMQLIRQSTSNLDTVSLRGTRGGSSISTKSHCIYMLSSIQPYFPTTADQTRFKEIEISANKKIKWSELSGIFNSLDNNISLKIFNFATSSVDLYKTTVVELRRYLEDKNLEARLVDTLGNLIAGYCVLVGDFDYPKITGMAFIHQEIEEAKENDSEKCLETILDLKINSMGRDTIQQLISYVTVTEEMYESPSRKELASYGVVYDAVDKTLFIASNNPELKKLLRDSPYGVNYKSLLKRHRCVIKECVKKIYGRPVRGVSLNYKDLCENFVTCNFFGGKL